MAKHYAINSNINQYTAYFDNTKSVTLSFPQAFVSPPMVQLTMTDSGSVPVYKTKVTESYVKIRFKTKWTGEVDVLVMER